MRRNLSIFLLALLVAGCATSRPTPSPARPATAKLFPPEGLVTQRAVLTVLGRQFTLNGYVSKSDARGLRLIMLENLGAVLADVLVKPDGKVLVMKARPPFKAAWVERYIAADLKCVFSDTLAKDCQVELLSPTHFLLRHRWYKLDLQTVEVKPGVQPAELFEEARGGRP